MNTTKKEIQRKLQIERHVLSAQLQNIVDQTNREITTTIQIVVGDGGVGFPADSLDQNNGTGGLVHIQRRVRLMGCDLLVQSQPGSGTRVIVHVPEELATP